MNFIHMYGGNQHVNSSDPSLVESLAFHHHNYAKIVVDNDDNEEGSVGSEKTSGSGGEEGGTNNYYTMNHLPFLHNPNSSSSNVIFHEDANSSSQELTQHNEARFDNGSLLSFGERVVVPAYTNKNYGLSHLKSVGVTETRVSRSDLNTSESKIIKDDQHGEEQFRWLYSVGVSDASIQETGCSETNLLKHPNSLQECEMKPTKKHCSGTSPKKPKLSKSCPAKDPQSLAAKNRRERISQRLKVLQDLVPNGSKVDLVTMLEKAINYVKFLQLQVKVLGTDEFWPTQGGKAPEIAKVKEAIDAILSSYRNSNSNSK